MAIYINGERTEFTSVLAAKRFLAEQKAKEAKAAASRKRTTTKAEPKKDSE